MPDVVTAGIVGGASLISGAMGANAAKSAAKTAANSEQAGIDFQRESRDLSLAYQKPSRDAGYQALAALMDMAGLTRPNTPNTAGSTQTTDTGQYVMMGNGPLKRRVPVQGEKRDVPALGSDVPNMSEFDTYDWMASNPGYRFRLEEGQRATENMLRSAGMLNSGKGLRAITRYGQDYASNEYDKSWARLASIAGIGQAAVNSGNASIGNAANSVQQGYSNIGQANAAGKIGQANAWSGAIDSAVGAYGMYKMFG